MDVVYAKSNTVLAHQGQRITVRTGEPWDADDPLVRRYPEFFAPRVPAARSTVDPRGFRAVPADEVEATDDPVEDQVVETTTRAPGEQRRTPTRRGGKAGSRE